MTDVRTSAQPGGVFVFHYSGHGDAPGIAEAAPIDENRVGNNGGEGVIGLAADFPAGARDGEIAAIVNAFPTSVGIPSAFDGGYAGETIDGTTDISRGLVASIEGRRRW